MYPLLRRGNRLPTVAATQILINRALKEGETIAVDGIFGKQTQGALKDFQRRRHITPNGMVDRSTWNHLNRDEHLQVVDAVDVTNPKDMGYEDEAIRSAGGDPIVSSGMCNGVDVVLNEIMHKAKIGNVALLRFHGHGSPGNMGVTVGTGGHASSEFGTRFLESLIRFVSRLGPIFSEFGSVELHGCRVGQGVAGRRLVRGLCRAWAVPVSAGTRTQYGGGRSTFRFEGHVLTACPGGKTLKAWAQGLSEAGMMSVYRP